MMRVALVVALVAVGAEVATAGSVFKKNITGIVDMVKTCDACIAKVDPPTYKPLQWRCPTGLALQADGKTCSGSVPKSCDAPLSSTVNGQCCASLPTSDCTLQTRACAEGQYAQQVCHPSGVSFLFEGIAANAINVAKGVAKGAQNQRLLPSLLSTDELGWPASEALAYHHVTNEQTVNPLIVVKKLDPVVILPEPHLSAIIPPPEVPPPNLKLKSVQPKLGIVLPTPKFRFIVNEKKLKTPDLPLAPSHSPKVGVILPQPHLWMDAPDLTHYVQKPLIVTERQGAVLNLTGLSPKKQVVFQFAKNPNVPIPLPDPTSPVFFEKLWNFYAQPLKQKAVLNGARPSRTVIDLSKVSYGDNYLVTLPEWIKVPGQSYSEIPGPTSPNFVAAMLDAASNGHFALPDVYDGVAPVGVLFNLTETHYRDSVKIEGIPPLEKKPAANTIIIDGTHGLAKLLPEKITVSGKPGDVSRTVVVIPDVEHAKDWKQMTVTKVPKDMLVTVEHGKPADKTILVDFTAGGQLPEPRPHVKKNGTQLLFEIPHAARGLEFTLPEKSTKVFELDGYDPQIVVVALNTTALEGLHGKKDEKYKWLFNLEAPVTQRPADKTIGHGGAGNLKVTVVELPEDFFGGFDATKSQMAFDLPLGHKGEEAKLVVTRCKGTASGCAEAVATDYGLALTALGGGKAAAKKALIGKKAGNLNFTIPAMELEQQCAFKCCNKDAKVACLPQVKVPVKTPALPFCPEGCSVDLLTKNCKCGAFKVADCPAGFLPCGGVPPNAFCMKAGSVDHPKASEIPVVAQCAGVALKCAGKGLETCAAKRKRMM